MGGGSDRLELRIGHHGCCKEYDGPYTGPSAPGPKSRSSEEARPCDGCGMYISDYNPDEGIHELSLNMEINAIYYTEKDLVIAVRSIAN